MSPDKELKHCNDSNPETILLTFDTGSLNKIDEWSICESCSKKSEFQNFRTSVTIIKGDNQK